MLLWATFTFIYKFLPNTYVRLASALVGGVVAAVALVIRGHGLRGTGGRFGELPGHLLEPRRSHSLFHLAVHRVAHRAGGGRSRALASVPYHFTELCSRRPVVACANGRGCSSWWRSPGAGATRWDLPQYHSGDLNGYHVSYWASPRGTTHIRKNRGFHLVSVSDLNPIETAPKETFEMLRIYKRAEKIRIMVNDRVIVAWDDDGKTIRPGDPAVRLDRAAPDGIYLANRL